MRSADRIERKPTTGLALVSQARQLFFEEGTLPSGLVNDAVWRSWQRCANGGRRVGDTVPFNPVRSNGVAELLEINRHLILAAQPTFRRLEQAFHGSEYGLLLTDRTGIAVAVHGPIDKCGKLLRQALRPGVDLSERSVGTNAMAAALAEERAVAVLGAEHYFVQNSTFQCVAAPIFGPDGHLVGSLDITRDTPLPQFGVLSLIVDGAAAIENALFQHLHAHLALALHWRSDDSAESGNAMLAFGPDGEVLGATRAARRLLELADTTAGLRFGHLFQGSYAACVDAFSARPGPQPLTLQSGLRVYASAVHALRELVSAPARTARLPVAQQRPAAPLPDFGDAATELALQRSLRALQAGLPVLLLGETGTGKEVAARALHGGSRASEGPFIAINCGAIPRELIEGELFGYADGAYTGARRGGARGRIEEADGGTLFLDEIGDMPLDLQTRLLRVLESREVTRLGESRTRKLDFQLIGATHQDLDALVKEQRFRSDLYFRLSGMQLYLPPLRQRSNLGALIEILLEEAGIVPGRMAPDCRAALLAYAWPGNTRQLRTTLRFAGAMADPGEPIGLQHLPDDIRTTVVEATPGHALVAGPGAPPAQLKELADEVINRALIQAEGNVSNAARQLGISRATLHRWINKQR
ncbi:transcriptional regulator of acetoin/glycerol metabolism [Massilia sp. UYP11]